MGTILLLALAAALYPQLLAVVVVILTRPNPRPLLWACYLGAVSVSVGSGVLIFAIFRSRGSVAGASSHRLGPAAFLVIGAIAVALAILVASRPGRELIGRDLPFPRPRARNPDRSATVSRMKSKAEHALRDGSIAVAVVVGALLALPGPFDLVALGHLARGDYTAIAAGLIIFAFALIKFLLIEVPLVSYTIDPDGTAARVGRFSAWMHANKLVVLAAIVAVVGVALIGRGIAALG
jgi:hypothetical protein